MTPRKKTEKRQGDAALRKTVPKPYQPQYGVIVLCESEKHQEKTYNELRKEGRKCKVVTA